MKTFGLIVVFVVFLFFVVGIMEKDRPLTEKEKFENAAAECLARIFPFDSQKCQLPQIVVFMA